MNFGSRDIDCVCSLGTLEDQTQSQEEEEGKKMREVTQCEAICHFSLLYRGIVRLGHQCLPFAIRLHGYGCMCVSESVWEEARERATVNM